MSERASTTRRGGPPYNFFAILPPPVPELVAAWRAAGANERWILKTLLEAAELAIHKPLHVPWWEWARIVPEGDWSAIRRQLQFQIGHWLSEQRREAWLHETPQPPHDNGVATKEDQKDHKDQKDQKLKDHKEGLFEKTPPDKNPPDKLPEVAQGGGGSVSVEIDDVVQYALPAPPPKAPPTITDTSVRFPTIDAAMSAFLIEVTATETDGKISIRPAFRKAKTSFREHGWPRPPQKTLDKHLRTAHPKLYRKASG
jgi:hypothetical protein